MGIRAGVSLLVSALVCYGIVGAFVLNHGWVDVNAFRQKWALWPGVGLLVTSGLTSFLWRWRSIARALFERKGAIFWAGEGRGRSARRCRGSAELVHLGFPDFRCGVCRAGGDLFSDRVVDGNHRRLRDVFSGLGRFARHWRDRHHTDRRHGQNHQLIYGWLAPGNMTTNLMTASLTGGAAIHTADLLTDLKSGYLLGANPRKQLIAQMWGVLAGTMFVVPGYLLLIKPDEIGTDKWPAPAAQVWAGVAKVLAHGLGALPQGAREAVLVGGAVGVFLTLIEELVPQDKKGYTISSAAAGIAWVIPAWNSFSMFFGAFLAWVFYRVNRPRAERYSLAVASGIIAGESLVAVAIAALVASHLLQAG